MISCSADLGCSLIEIRERLTHAKRSTRECYLVSSLLGSIQSVKVVLARSTPFMGMIGNRTGPNGVVLTASNLCAAHMKVNGYNHDPQAVLSREFRTCLVFSGIGRKRGSFHIGSATRRERILSPSTKHSALEKSLSTTDEQASGHLINAVRYSSTLMAQIPVDREGKLGINPVKMTDTSREGKQSPRAPD